MYKLNLSVIDTFYENLEQISINDVPKYDENSKKLLDLSENKPKKKSRDEVWREFNTDKYKKYLDLFVHKKWNSFEEFRREIIGESPLLPRVYKKNLFLLEEYKHTEIQSQIIDQVLNACGEMKNVVELGAGYGSVLFDIAQKEEMQRTNFIGAELTKNGTELINKIAEEFNLNNVSALQYDIASKEELDFILPDSVVFTNQCLMYLKDLDLDFMQRLIEKKPRYVVFFEPVCPEENSETLMELFARKYILTNDYNVNLSKIIGEAVRCNLIQLVEHIPQLTGYHPFLSSSLFVWKPA